MRHANWLILALSIPCLSNTALAASASASAGASLDWSTFSVSTISLGAGTPMLTWIDSSYSASTSAITSGPDLSQTDFVPDWGTGSLSSAGDSSTQAWAEIAADAISANASDVNPTGGSSATASAIRHGEFTVSGNGLILFSVTYSLAIDFYPDGYSPSSNATASATLGAAKATSSSNSNHLAYELLFPSSPSSGFAHSERKTGTLYLPVVVADGEIYSFYAQATSSAAISGSTDVPSVPLPAAVWPFVSGLIGLAGASLSRRRIA
ncbi:VPLPA-CTERM sorting domain-containing protein [Methylomonas sp. CM2]|uniref:VPLPA-CTERM sorting domain-containing protein n=1 Tax=Methylomonas sp. CM2 TaxID=3417647 RepID=UPI003CE8A41F